MTPSAVLEVVSVLENAYRVHFKPQQVETWQAFLQEVGDRAGRRAAEELVRTQERLPTISQVLAAARDYRHEDERDLGRPALPNPESDVSLNPGEQAALLKAMREKIGEIREAGVPVEAGPALLVSWTADRVNEARARRGRAPTGG